MRLPILLPLVLGATMLAPGPVPGSDCAPVRAASTKVPFRPRAWSPPSTRMVASPAAGMTEGEPAPGTLGQSRAQALAGVVVEVRPDGSRRAVLGGAIRAWSVASLDERGRLELDCASSEAAAVARVCAAASRGGK